VSNPFVDAMAMVFHVHFGPLIRKLTQSGVPDLLDAGPMRAVEVAAKAGLHPQSLTRALRALSAFGIFRETSAGTFENTDASRLFRNQPGGLRNWTLFATAAPSLRTAEALGHTLATGESAHDHANGMGIWEYLKQDPELNNQFNLGLGEIRKDEQSQIARAYDWSQVGTVIDVGGGAGHLLAAALGQNTAMKGVLFDRPDVLRDGEGTQTARGVRNRVELVGGSFFEPIRVPMSGAGRWILSQILHDWPDADSVRILKQCRAAMRPEDRLLVVEMVPVPGKPDPTIARLDVMMLMYFGEARQRTLDEYKLLFAESGFELVREMPTGTDFSIVEAKP
jgi:SAM-dependent methyltransferase